MKISVRLAVLVGLFLFCLGLARAQLIIGQYEDEAPMQTWNIFGLPGATEVGLAGTQFTLASDTTALFANPALMTRLPHLSATVSGYYTSTDFYRYSLVNTGVISSEANLPLGVHALESAAVSVRFGSWAFGVGYGLPEVYDRPPVNINYITYELTFDQSGALNVLNFSLARAFGRHVSIGFGFNMLSGKLARSTFEKFSAGLETITNDITQDFKGSYFNGGLFFDVVDSFHVSLVFRAPYTKKADSRAVLSHIGLGGRTIVIQAAARDEYQEPLAAGLGLSYGLQPNWHVVCDLSYFNWSKYKVTSFDEPLARNFRDCLKVSLGMEYFASFTFAGQEFTFPVRGGIALDQQPMKDPRSAYVLYALGAGLHWKHASLDLGVLVGRESGSGRSLATKKAVLSLGVTI
jgi:long-subunit fatty acid transport protein